ncbi:MAG: transglycosylase SLT domain-containing protein [Bacilli bacterium]|nr:transglycosylase SLT domain-containing protein [Bacilli bacterium]
MNNIEPSQEQSNDDNGLDKFDSIIATNQIDDGVSYTVDDLKYDIEESEIVQDAVEMGETSLIEQIEDQLVYETNHHAYLDYQLSTDIEKRNHAYNEYHDLVERFSAKWGMSSNLVMAILTQESGGYKTNLMQIEFDEWDEEIIKVYNFEDDKYDYFVLTNNPEKWASQNVTCITEKDLDNPVTNISIGCVLLRKSAEYMDYHVLAAIQCNNLGKGNMDKVLAQTALETGQTIDEMLADQENISFYQYTDIVEKGDPEYLSNVFAFLSDYGDVITFKHFDENHEIVEEVIYIFSTQQENTYHK